jgi:hypothetical protein
MTSGTEARIGSLIAAGGIGWAAYHATSLPDPVQGLSLLYLKTGPLETCAIGILIWLHAKYRRSTSYHL